MTNSPGHPNAESLPADPASAGQALEQRARQIFGDVLPLADPHLREQALEQACAGDAAVKARVLELLTAYERAQAADLLGNPTAADLSTTVPAGTTIGRYKLLEVIGEGGF